MTREELKKEVSEAGKHFIEGVNTSVYRKRWIDTQTFVDDLKVERLMYEIEFYNKELKRWLESGCSNDAYRTLSYGYYCCIEGMLYTLRDIVYFKPDKYGDINPFIDYCWACWFERCPINFDEYEYIRGFLEEGKE